MTNVQHNALAGSGLHQPYHYEQATDPGPIGEGGYWLDTSAPPYSPRRRNATDDGWVGISGDGVLDIRDFGAVAGGTRDNSGPIQAAIDAAPPGTTIRVPPGVFLIETGLLMTKWSQRLVGSGSGLNNSGSLIRYEGEGAAVTVRIGTGNCQQAAVSDIGIESFAYAPDSVGIHVVGSTGVSLERVTVGGIRTGFKIDGSYSVNLSHVGFEGAFAGHQMDTSIGVHFCNQANSNTLGGGFFMSWPNIGVLIEGSSGNSIRDGDVEGHSGPDSKGIYILSQGILPGAIDVLRCEGNRIDNVWTEVIAEAIVLDGRPDVFGAHGVIGTCITGGVIASGVTTSLHIFEADNTTVIGHSARFPILLDAGATHTRFIGCREVAITNLGTGTLIDGVLVGIDGAPV